MNLTEKINNIKGRPGPGGMVVMAVLSAMLIIIGLPTLDLPHYWDEAYPYSYAIGYMVENGVGLFSGSAPVEYTKGHPLLYHFLQAAWNTMVGEAMWLQRILPLLISLGCLWMTYLLGKGMFNRFVGIGGAVLLVGQNTFLANATAQLPEMLLTFLLLTSLYFLLTSRKRLFITSTTLMLFVKEPAVILLALVFTYDLLILQSNRAWNERLKRCVVYMLPVGISVLFYIHQYVEQGWFLYPEHTKLVTLSADRFFDQLSRYFAHLFIYDGRNGLFFTALIFFTWFLIKKGRSISLSMAGKQSILPGILIVGYLLFSAANFYSNRYILCLFPLFCLLVSAGLYYSLKPYLAIFGLGVVILSGVTFWFSFSHNNKFEYSLQYANAVRCQQQAVEYCLEQGWQDVPIHTTFLMHKNLTSHYPGYLDKGELFTHVNRRSPEEAEILLLCNNEDDLEGHPAVIQAALVKQFNMGASSCSVYRKE